MAGEESEALGFGREQTGCELAVADTYLTVVGYGTGDAESLQALADVFGSLNSVFCLLFKRNGSTNNVCPFSIFKANHLRFFTGLIRIEASGFTDLVGFFDRSDAVCVKTSENLLDTTVL